MAESLFWNTQNLNICQNTGMFLKNMIKIKSHLMVTFLNFTT